MVIIDTSIWVDVLRGGDSSSQIEVERLIRERQAATVGIIYAEVLRGARDDDEIASLLRYLDNSSSFIDSRKSTLTLAGRLLSDLDRKGTSIPLPDAVIAAHALEGKHAIFTRDEHFRRVPDLRLHVASGGVG